MSADLSSIQKELRRLGFRAAPAGEDFLVYTELFVNDGYRLEQIKQHLFKEPVPEATVIVDLGANKNWFLHLLEERAELGRNGRNVHYFRIEPQPLTVTYPSGSPMKVYHINRAVVPDAEDQDQFFPLSYDIDFSALAGSSLVPKERIGSEVPPMVMNEKNAAFVMYLATHVTAATAEIHVETIGPKRLFDRISAELARLNIARHRTLVKIDSEYKELTIASDVLSYISQHEQWRDFLLVAETGGGGTFDSSHRANFAVEEYLVKTGLPNEWIFKMPYLLAQPAVQQDTQS